MKETSARTPEDIFLPGPEPRYSTKEEKSGLRMKRDAKYKKAKQYPVNPM